MLQTKALRNSPRCSTVRLPRRTFACHGPSPPAPLYNCRRSALHFRPRSVRGASKNQGYERVADVVAWARGVTSSPLDVYNCLQNWKPINAVRLLRLSSLREEKKKYKGRREKLVRACWWPVHTRWRSRWSPSRTASRRRTLRVRKVRERARRK